MNEEDIKVPEENIFRVEEGICPNCGAKLIDCIGCTEDDITYPGVKCPNGCDFGAFYARNGCDLWDYF